MKQTTANKSNSRPAWQLWNSTAGTYTRRDIIRAAWTIYAAAVREIMCSTYSDVRQPRILWQSLNTCSQHLTPYL